MSKPGEESINAEGTTLNGPLVSPGNTLQFDVECESCEVQVWASVVTTNEGSMSHRQESWLNIYVEGGIEVRVKL